MSNDNKEPKKLTIEELEDVVGGSGGNNGGNDNGDNNNYGGNTLHKEAAHRC